MHADTKRLAGTFFIVPWIILVCSEGVTGHFHRVGFPFPLMRPLDPLILVRVAVMMFCGTAVMALLLLLLWLAMTIFSMATNLVLASVLGRGLWQRRWLPRSDSVTTLTPCLIAVARPMAYAALLRRDALRRGPWRRLRRAALATKPCVVKMSARPPPPDLGHLRCGSRRPFAEERSALVEASFLRRSPPAVLRIRGDGLRPRPACVRLMMYRGRRMELAAAVMARVRSSRSPWRNRRAGSLPCVYVK